MEAGMNIRRRRGSLTALIVIVAIVLWNLSHSSPSLGYMIGEIGIWGGLVTLALNVATMTAAPRSPDLPKRRFVAIWASVVGLVVCLITFVVGIPGATMEGAVLDYGWPFFIATTDRFQPPIGSEWIVGDVAFWLLAPQILVYLYTRFGAPSTRNTESL
jgi:hypothetical protein